ncbi:4-hydroxyphenylpyruvate dioxygenase-like protein [Gopherus flavomarginatus]|uniref:4-hydroxyphenylpyruvate dioxygenase-like protein n=1 Tax=Gopherus flavomarginatus TaxID=286002 RepID=UPI0021CC2F5C|nr:4-hydroxyphenylpyruvate dioxygenase-like protein [Gopherus flavomarginatus]
MTAFLSRLSHIAFHVPTGTGLVSDLVDKFRFHLFAELVTARARQLALCKGAAVFLVNERLGEAPPAQTFPFDPTRPALAQQPVLGHSDGEFLYDISPLQPVSTASNVCFEVQDVPTVSQSLQERGCPLAIPPTDVTDSGGSVTYCVVRSVVGNISHTLLDCSRYRGAFLPGFRATGDVPEGPRDPAEATHFDHITYACSRGSTQAVLDWYQHCFGFQRFIMNRQEDVAEGYRIHGHGVGLRLTAMRYGKGSEPRLVNDCKIVLAEPLPEPGKNQVDAFLEQHGGAGIQHVGLYTTDIVSTARALAQAGVRFVETPQAYYSEVGKAEEIRAAGQDPWLLSQHGILLDAELVGDGEGGGRGSSPRQRKYLMQIFTKPIFPEETFFLELIERWGAAGFGEGNIRALWRSVQAYLDKQE